MSYFAIYDLNYFHFWISQYFGNKFIVFLKWGATEVQTVQPRTRAADVWHAVSHLFPHNASLGSMFTPWHFTGKYNVPLSRNLHHHSCVKKNGLPYFILYALLGFIASHHSCFHMLYFTIYRCNGLWCILGVANPGPGEPQGVLAFVFTLRSATNSDPRTRWGELTVINCFNWAAE